jgi:hypothetical protein
VQSEKRWRVVILCNNNSETFRYDSTERDSYLAVAVATKEMFKQQPWHLPSETRILAVEVEDMRFIKDRDEDLVSQSEG